MAFPLFLAKLAGVTLIIGDKGVSCKLFFALVIFNLLLVAKNIVVSLSVISILRLKVRLFVLILKAVRLLFEEVVVVFAVITVLLLE